MKTFFEKIRRLVSGKSFGAPTLPLAERVRQFREILALNNRILSRIAELNEKLGGDFIFDQVYIHTAVREVSADAERLVLGLERLAPGRYRTLVSALARIQSSIEREISGRNTLVSTTFIMPGDDITADDVDAVGGKATNLAEVGRALGLRIPRCYGITASAYHAFLVTNELGPVIEEIGAARRAGGLSVQEASSRIRERFLSGRLPGRLEKELAEAVGDLARDGAGVALRSSAWLEDGSRSFAGQYRSVVNVTAESAAAAYREVLASLFSVNAIAYREKFGFRDHETAMPVLCQEMIDAEASGVLYTRGVREATGDAMVIAAVWGLGGPLVSGSAAADRFKVSRHAPRAIGAMDIVRKLSALRAAPAGGTRMVPLEPERQTQPCLGSEQILRVAEAGMRIEQHFRRPQDIEFAYTPDGGLVVLQARPLAAAAVDVQGARELSRLLRGKPVLFRDKGEVAQRGIGAGPVHLIRSDDDIADFPEGAVLVTRIASPLFASVLDRAAAVITDVGATTGHLATVAREYRVPMILNCGDATALLSPGREITVDAEDNVVYDGIVLELREYAITEDPIEDSYEYRLLRRVLRRIEPLRLIDPLHEDFRPESCRSLHDITRFVHEKAVEELIEGETHRTASAARDARRLSWHIPLDVTFVDAGGGIRAGAGRTITPDDVTSPPMKALLDGLAVPGAWSGEPVSVDFGSFLSSLSRTMSPELMKPSRLTRNLAVVSGDYINLSVRLGYHFTMVDAYASNVIGDNYIYFRFFGGVTDTVRRNRRAEFLRHILARFNFRVEQRGDLVVGRIKRIPKDEIHARLRLLGILIGFTRQLDVRMVDTASVAAFSKAFTTILEESHGYEDEHSDLG